MLEKIDINVVICCLVLLAIVLLLCRTTKEAFGNVSSGRGTGGGKIRLRPTPDAKIPDQQIPQLRRTSPQFQSHPQMDEQTRMQQLQRQREMEEQIKQMQQLQHQQQMPPQKILPGVPNPMSTVDKTQIKSTDMTIDEHPVVGHAVDSANGYGNKDSDPMSWNSIGNNIGSGYVNFASGMTQILDSVRKSGDSRLHTDKEFADIGRKTRDGVERAQKGTNELGEGMAMLASRVGMAVDGRFKDHVCVGGQCLSENDVASLKKLLN